MSYSDLFYIIPSVALVWYWLDGMPCKEMARRAGKIACNESSVLFLDDSVAINKVRLKRNEFGQMSLYRIYHFEFTGNGEQRSHGEVHIMGKHVVETNMDAYRI
jgi:Protein of unknown function (DUF3301)